MILLVNGGTKDVAKLPVESVGILISPRCGNSMESILATGRKWAADNDAFLAWNEELFRKMLRRIAGVPGCLFVAAPDVVGDGAATLGRFGEWIGALRAAGQPIGYVLQDGCENTSIPWRDFDAVFVGGTTEFKLSHEAAGLICEAKRLGKWVHMGRVNTRGRFRHAKESGCDSIDGSSFSRWPGTNLPAAMRWMGRMKQERTLF